MKHSTVRDSQVTGNLFKGIFCHGSERLKWLQRRRLVFFEGGEGGGEEVLLFASVLKTEFVLPLGTWPCQHDGVGTHTEACAPRDRQERILLCFVKNLSLHFSFQTRFILESGSRNQLARETIRGMGLGLGMRNEDGGGNS